MLTSWRTKSRSQTTFTFKIRPGKYAWLAWENRLINSQFKPFCTLRSHWSEVPIADESQRTKPNNREGTDHQTLLTRLSSAWMFFLTNKKKNKTLQQREIPCEDQFQASCTSWRNQYGQWSRLAAGIDIWWYNHILHLDTVAAHLAGEDERRGRGAK